MQDKNIIILQWTESQRINRLCPAVQKEKWSRKHTGYMALEAVWILNSRTEVEVGGVLGRGNRISNALVARKIWGVHGEEQWVKSNGFRNFKLGSHGLQTEKMGKIQFSKALNADLNKLLLILQTVESHIGLLSNYVIIFDSPLFYKKKTRVILTLYFKRNYNFLFNKWTKF